MLMVIQTATVTSYSDDTKLSQTIKNPEDVASLQRDTIYKWAEESNMQFNDGKFQALRYQPTNAPQSEYRGPEGSTIPESHSVSERGINMSNDASFYVRITKLATKCRQLVRWILSLFRTREQEVMLTLWKKFVLSRLDYCSQIWSPHSVKLTAELEAIQRCYTKKIPSMQQMS